jgi:hypothetical protein
VLRRAAKHGPQIVTKHGAEIAVVLDIAEYRRLAGHTAPRKTFSEHLLTFPKLGLSDDEFDELFARSPEPESSRKTPFVGPGWEE